MLNGSRRIFLRFEKLGVIFLGFMHFALIVEALRFLFSVNTLSVAFSALWDGRLVYGLVLWGTLGTAWWYLLGRLICGLCQRRTTNRQPLA